MEVDPNFEFECPKWYDFTQEDGDQEECLDDSWFEREHPLHEPKDKEKNIQELKPLIEINEKQTDNKKAMGSKNTERNTKYKKSLGVKKTVQLKRGENGQGKRKLPDTTRMKRRNSSEGSQNKDHELGGQMEKKRDFSNSSNFTPPWGLHSPSTRPGGGGEGDMSPKTALSCSPLRGPLMSPPIHSPKNTLLAKAVNKAAGVNRRRILPAVPCTSNNTQNQEISSHLPLRGATMSESDIQSSYHSGPESNVIKSKSSTTDTNVKQLIIPARQNTDANSMNSTDVIMKDQKQDRGEDSSMSVEELLKQHNQKVFASKSKYDSNGRRIQRRSVATVIGTGEDRPGATDHDQHNSEVFVTHNEISTNPNSFSKEPKTLGAIHENPSSKGVNSKHETDTDTSAEALLKLHNQRIMASKCKYDCNGRRIRTATPSFCAAPTKSDKPEKPNITTKDKGRRSVTSSTGTTIKNKRLSSSTTNNETQGTTAVKQQRRSCIADPKMQETFHRTTNRSKRKPTASCSTAGVKDVTSKGSSSELKRNATTQDVKPGLKNKRRSCVTLPVSSLQSSGLTKGTSRHKRRSCVAAPQTPKRLASDSVDQELKDMIARHNKRFANNK